MCSSGCIQPKAGYLELLRKLTKELGIVKILDEVITGFRLSTGGAHKRFGIDPDLITIGKAMGGGIAISAVAGKADILKLVDNGTVSHLGTLNGNCVAIAAALATIRELAKDQGAAYTQLEQRFTTLAAGIRGLLAKHQISCLINQVGLVFHMMFTDEKEVTDFDSFNRREIAKYARFAETMLGEGMLLRPSGLWYISTAHTEQDIELTLQAIDRSGRQATVRAFETVPIK
jgi:glutamate-1-semialdehyde 2,1-aminomutase